MESYGKTQSAPGCALCFPIRFPANSPASWQIRNKSPGGSNRSTHTSNSTTTTTTTSSSSSSSSSSTSLRSPIGILIIVLVIVGNPMGKHKAHPGALCVFP